MDPTRGGPCRLRPTVWTLTRSSTSAPQSIPEALQESYTMCQSWPRTPDSSALAGRERGFGAPEGSNGHAYSDRYGRHSIRMRGTECRRMRAATAHSDDRYTIHAQDVEDLHDVVSGDHKTPPGQPRRTAESRPVRHDQADPDGSGIGSAGHPTRRCSLEAHHGGMQILRFSDGIDRYVHGSVWRKPLTVACVMKLRPEHRRRRHADGGADGPLTRPPGRQASRTEDRARSDRAVSHPNPHAMESRWHTPPQPVRRDSLSKALPKSRKLPTITRLELAEKQAQR